MNRINDLIETGNDWQYEAIMHAGPHEHHAFIRSPRGTVTLGIFNTHEEAQQAITEAQQARWNG
jgi:hypothetical protein